MLRRLPGRSQTLGLAIGFAGIAAIALPTLTEGSSEATGVLLALLATICYGVAINIAAPLTQRYGSLPVMARMLALASVLTAPLGLLAIRGSALGGASLAAVSTLGVLGTGLAFVLMGRLVAHVGSARASFATYQIPVVAMVLGVVFRDDRVHALSVAGIGLVIVGALLASRKERPS